MARYEAALFDYSWRAMPADAPQSLEPYEVYAIIAYLLHANDIFSGDTVMDQNSLPQVIMPNQDDFTSPDPRPDVFNEAEEG